MSDKTITLPADLGGGWDASDLRRAAGRLAEGVYAIGVATLLHRLAGELELQCPPPMDEPTRLGAVVVARRLVTGDDFDKWTLADNDPGESLSWVNSKGHWVRWSDLINPRLATDEELEVSK